MNVLVRILTQYIDENGKRKGGQEFTTQMDSDALLYAEDETLKTLFQRLIDTQMANFAGKYIYVECKLVWHEPIDLGDSNAAYDKLVEEIYHV